jgi:hypothetical protein
MEEILNSVILEEIRSLSPAAGAGSQPLRRAAAVSER